MVVGTSLRHIKIGEQFTKHYGNKGKLDIPELHVVKRRITFGEYIVALKQNYPTIVIPSHMNEEDAIRDNREFYELLTN